MFKIFKIGGIAFQKQHVFNDLRNLTYTNNEYYFIVISALKNVSRLLKSASENAFKGKKNSFYENLEEIIDIHKEFISRNFPKKESKFYDLLINYKVKLEKLLHSVYITGYLSHKTSDLILACGEDLLLDILRIDLSGNELVSIIDSRDIIRTDSNFQKAVPNYEISDYLIKSTVKSNSARHFITQGFVAADEFGNTTTMGFESSNLTAMIIAKALDAREIRIVTDVSGIFVADPKIFPSSELISEMPYDKAIKAANYGLKLLYAPMLKQAAESDIKIFYSDSLTRFEELTLISNCCKFDSSLFIYRDVLQLSDEFTENDLSEPGILEFADNLNKIFITESKRRDIYSANELININQYGTITFLFYELSLILSSFSNTLNQNDDTKIFVPEKDVIHIITSKEKALEFGNFLLKKFRL